jgi:photosystem II stability/assembly factor-like uncharacterized protein
MSKLGRLYTTANGGTVWTERRPDGIDLDREWRCVASDADGSNLIAGQYSAVTGAKSRLYTSADSGVTWTERKPAGDVNKSWGCVASDADGSFLIACVYVGRVYASTNGGTTWTELQPNGNVNVGWDTVACDSDGSVIILDGGSYVYTSLDGGSSWTAYGVYQANGLSVVCNGDGSLLAYVDYTEDGWVFVSDDSGTTWYGVQPHYSRWYQLVRVSKTGATFLTATDINTQYLGTWHFDYHYMTWGTVKSLGFSQSSADANSDITNVVYVKWGGRIYISTDSGVNYAETRPEGDASFNWSSVASDESGFSLIVCANHYEVALALKSNAIWFQD